MVFSKKEHEDVLLYWAQALELAHFHISFILGGQNLQPVKEEDAKS